jgi:hypothetical protein
VQRLPPDYRALLFAHNGGFVEEFRYTFLTGVPFETDTVDTVSRDDSPVEFFGVPTTEAAGRWPRDLLQVAVDHASEEFLPSNLLAIASCVQSSLVCISLSGPDLGAIYYWDWYWQYPWCKAFFDQRIEDVRQRIPDHPTVLSDPSNPRYRQVVDAFNYATVTPLADSLGKWLLSCSDRRGRTKPDHPLRRRLTHLVAEDASKVISSMSSGLASTTCGFAHRFGRVGPLDSGAAPRQGKRR